MMSSKAKMEKVVYLPFPGSFTLGEDGRFAASWSSQAWNCSSLTILRFFSPKVFCTQCSGWRVKSLIVRFKIWLARITFTSLTGMRLLCIWK